MINNKLLEFEQELRNYTGAPHVVLTDCCTHALELCVRYTKVSYVTCAKKTYLSVPMMLHKTETNFDWDSTDWQYEYQLGKSGIWDSARAFDKNMYRAGQFQCLSFGYSKRLEILHGGAILLDNPYAYKTLRQMAYDGRDMEISPWQEQKKFKIGYHYNMRLDDAERGLYLLQNNRLKSRESQHVDYPDCSELIIDT